MTHDKALGKNESLSEAANSLAHLHEMNMHSSYTYLITYYKST